MLGSVRSGSGRSDVVDHGGLLLLSLRHDHIRVDRNVLHLPIQLKRLVTCRADSASQPTISVHLCHLCSLKVTPAAALRNDSFLGVGIVTFGISGTLDSDPLVLAAPQEEASDELRAYPCTACLCLSLSSFSALFTTFIHHSVLLLIV